MAVDDQFPVFDWFYDENQASLHALNAEIRAAEGHPSAVVDSSLPGAVLQFIQFLLRAANLQYENLASAEQPWSAVVNAADEAMDFGEQMRVYELSQSLAGFERPVVLQKWRTWSELFREEMQDVEDMVLGRSAALLDVYRQRLRDSMDLGRDLARRLRAVLEADTRVVLASVANPAAAKQDQEEEGVGRPRDEVIEAFLDAQIAEMETRWEIREQCREDEDAECDDYVLD